MERDLDDDVDWPGRDMHASCEPTRKDWGTPPGLTTPRFASSHIHTHTTHHQGTATTSPLSSVQAMWAGNMARPPDGGKRTAYRSLTEGGGGWAGGQCRGLFFLGYPPSGSLPFALIFRMRLPSRVGPSPDLRQVVGRSKPDSPFWGEGFLAPNRI